MEIFNDFCLPVTHFLKLDSDVIHYRPAFECICAFVHLLVFVRYSATKSFTGIEMHLAIPYTLLHKRYRRRFFFVVKPSLGGASLSV